MIPHTHGAVGHPTRCCAPVFTSGDAATPVLPAPVSSTRQLPQDQSESARVPALPEQSLQTVPLGQVTGPPPLRMHDAIHRGLVGRMLSPPRREYSVMVHRCHPRPHSDVALHCVSMPLHPTILDSYTCSAEPSAHPVMESPPQTPTTQLSPAAHVRPQAPQFMESESTFTHRVPQTMSSLGHVHRPEVHDPPVGQTVPHDPQLLESVERFTQREPHKVRPEEHMPDEASVVTDPSGTPPSRGVPLQEPER